MSDVEVRIATAATLVWIGMLVAISFMEAPLKFRAPGLELRVGLAIGRIVFRALNVAELVWAIVLAVALGLDPQSGVINGLAIGVGAVLVVQLAVVRPWLNRRSNRVLSGERPADAPRSKAHLVYVAFEVVKLAALIALACYLLAA
jgi:hypothetical protein